jgi:trehalose 6-phosphate phosphatase
MSARPARGAAAALDGLARRLSVVAIVTGRSATDVRRLSGIDGALVVGNHGIEWLPPGSAQPEAVEARPQIESRLAAALAAVTAAAGTEIERKGLSATVHYRNAPDPAAVRDEVLRRLARVVHPGLEIREGRMAVELRPRGLGDKGSAARNIIGRHGLRGAVVLGDDVTDLDMFRAVRELRDAGLISAAIIGVGRADGEVPPEVLAAADVALADPDEAAALLAALDGALSSR